MISILSAIILLFVAASLVESSAQYIPFGFWKASNNTEISGCNGNTWTLSGYFKAPNNNSEDLFGTGTTVYGDTVAVGAPDEDSSQTTITTTASTDNSATDAGAVYVYKKTILTNIMNIT